MLQEDQSRLQKHFSTYVLPGRVVQPRRALEEAVDAASIGLGGMWLSERYATKEPAVLGGALAVAAPSLRLAATFYAHMRHPVVTASIANVMQAMTGDRFTLVLARASPEFFRGFDVPTLTFDRVRDTISIMHGLWSGETIEYEGLLGKFSGLRLTDRHIGPPPPIIFTAIGPKALAFAGTYCDGVLLHPLLTVEAVREAAVVCRSAAARAGRDPAAFRVVANVIVAPELPRAQEEAVVGGRAVTYLQAALGEVIAAANKWDLESLQPIREHEKLAHLEGAIASKSMSRDDLVEVSRALPPEWLAAGAAAGSAEYCAERLCEYVAAGADEILLHGAAPSEMRTLTRALCERLK